MALFDVGSAVLRFLSAMMTLMATSSAMDMASEKQKDFGLGNWVHSCTFRTSGVPCLGASRG